MDRHQTSKVRCSGYVALAALLVGMTAVGPVQAQCTTVDLTASLQPTKAAVDLGALGSAGLQVAADCGQMLGVNVVADLPDGEVLTVFMTTETGTTALGFVPMFQGLGQLVITAPAPSAVRGKTKRTATPDVSGAQRITVYRNPNGTAALSRPILRPRMLVAILDGSF